MSILYRDPEQQIEDSYERVQQAEAWAQELESELDHARAELRSAEEAYDQLYEDFLGELKNRSDLEKQLKAVCALANIDPSDV